MYKMVIAPGKPLLHQVSHSFSAFVTGWETQDPSVTEGRINVKGVKRLDAAVRVVQGAQLVTLANAQAEVPGVQHTATATLQQQPAHATTITWGLVN